MKYDRTKSRQLILSLAFLSLAVSISSWHIPSVKLVSITVFVFCICNAFVTYQVVINKHTIRYTIKLFGLKIYNKKIIHSDVAKITFKRIGWNSKLAVIKVRKGLSIRVTYFKPNDVYKNLIVFCVENEIPFKKTKDFKMIENMG
ncbi:hypothetical protein MKY07_08650 [Solibacillus sp. FSL W7-1472]|uniref:hypothetical protein n=1 Tax=Solibacillus sp. FSL W7-1472 TaxID=2921707 RepID=UPI0007FB510F|nr:hypothetical protein [Solibacillus silvestris]OBW60604.1 hypothetical protein A9986_05375 [Solibacillus silvestris]